MTTRELIEAAIYELENMPCGGVGEGGSTQKELDRDVLCGEIEDATYHNSQQAWLYLQQALANVIEDEAVEKRLAELCD